VNEDVNFAEPFTRGSGKFCTALRSCEIGGDEHGLRHSRRS
jgi:hypothetical protein